MFRKTQRFLKLGSILQIVIEFWLFVRNFNASSITVRIFLSLRRMNDAHLRRKYGCVAGGRQSLFRSCTTFMSSGTLLIWKSIHWSSPRRRFTSLTWPPSWTRLPIICLPTAMYGVTLPTRHHSEERPLPKRPKLSPLMPRPEPP